jgi:hypothetical protein
MSNTSEFSLKIEWNNIDMFKNLDNIVSNDEEYGYHNLYLLNENNIYITTYTNIEGDLGKTFLQYLIDGDYLEGNQITKNGLKVFEHHNIKLSKLGIDCIKADNMIDYDYIYILIMPTS